MYRPAALFLCCLVIAGCDVEPTGDPTGRQVEPPKPSGIVKIGGRATLTLEKPGQVFLAVDTPSYNQLRQEIAAQDVARIGAMIATGRAFMVPSGTEVVVIDAADNFSLRVRIVGEAGNHRTGWVPMNFVKPLD